MKTTRYRFEQAVQEVREETTQWLRDEFKSVLESDKDFTRKADYIGYSIAGIDSKVSSIDEEIKELQELKKRLKSAKDIALSVGAEVFNSYGIEKLEGAGISSITMSKASTKTKESFEILDEDVLIDAGYVTTVIDTQAVRDAYNEQDPLVQKCCKLSVEEISTPSKLKINKRRSANNKDGVDPYTDSEELAS